MVDGRLEICELHAPTVAYCTVVGNIAKRLEVWRVPEWTQVQCEVEILNGGFEICDISALLEPPNGISR